MGQSKNRYIFPMVVIDDVETERVFTAEKVAPVKKNGLDRSCSCWGASSCGGNAFRWNRYTSGGK